MSQRIRIARREEGSRRISSAGDATIPRSFSLRPNTYAAYTQPGLEGVAFEEIAARYEATGIAGGEEPDPQRKRRPVVRELARRTIPDRAGITIFSAPRPDLLPSIRTAEDIFAVIAFAPISDTGVGALARVRAAARSAPFVEDAIAAHSLTLRGSRGGRRMRFRIVARMAGEHPFRRVDFQRAVEQGIREREDHTWRFSEDQSDVEFWATMFQDEVLVAVRLSDERMRHRDYKVAHIPGSLRPSVAAAMAWLSEPKPDDVVLDPMCGAATVLIERAHLGRYQMLIGSDSSRAALDAARVNIGPRYKPIQLNSWDAAAIPMPDGSIDAIITNLPWGVRHGSHEDNRRFYPRLMKEFTRLIRPEGKIVMLTGETRLVSSMITHGVIRPQKTFRVSILGASASIYVIRGRDAQP